MEEKKKNGEYIYSAGVRHAYRENLIPPLFSHLLSPSSEANFRMDEVFFLLLLNRNTTNWGKF